MDDAPSLGSLSEENAARLLDRAARLDAQRGSAVTIDELRQVAVEAGISEEAFERALAEMTVPGTSAPIAPAAVDLHASRGGNRPVSLLTTLVQRTGIFITGSVMAFLSMTFISDVGMDSEPVMVFTLAVAALLVAWSAVTKRRDRKVLDFEVDLGVLWTSMTFWLMVLNPDDVGTVLEVMMPAGFLASVLGGFFVATGPSDSEPERLPERV